MARKAPKYNNAAGKTPGKAVSIYVNLGQTAQMPHDLASQQKTSGMPDSFTACLFVDYRHEVARSFYLIPRGTRQVKITIEHGTPGPKVIEFVDSNLQSLHRTETAVPGTLMINVSEFRNGCCFLRLDNGRLLCISIDKWPDLQPPFMREYSYK